LNLWARSIRAYASPDVERLCLRLQDEDGQCVSYLLWALWVEEQRCHIDPPLAARAAALARSFETGVLVPLRTARRSLRAALDSIPEPAREAARARIKTGEMAAEELLLRGLEAMTPPGRLPSGAPGALRLACAAWRPAAPTERMSELAGAFSKTGFSAKISSEMPFSDDPALANDEAINARIAELRQAHHDLDDAVQALSARAVPDQLQIARLKRQKLALRDQISALEDRLTPDIIA
jgi:uncharacterized protein (TIGR02444 family)